MNKAQKKTVSLILFIAGAVLLIGSIICFIITGAMVSSMQEFFSWMGVSPSVSNLKALLSTTESAASMMGGFGMGDLYELSGITRGQIGMLKFCIGGRIWMLVLGLLSIGGGGALMLLDIDPRTVKRAKDALGKSVNSASLMVKDAVDKATVKCPSCGKICTAKTAFCPACGSKMPTPAGKVVCPGCGAIHSAGRAFCTTCGSALPKPEPAAPARKNVCPACGAACDSHSAFCSECGLKLTPPAPVPLPPAEEKIPCPGCGAMHAPKAAFCTSCGMRFSAPAPAFEPAPVREANIFCTNCGAKLPANARVCPSCGAPADD